jgi:hypothetical protein
LGIAPGVAQATVVSVDGGDSGRDIVSQLEKLNQLYQTGAITNSEYEQAKAKLLA